MKKFCVMIAILFSLLFSSVAINAAFSNDYRIEKVEIDGTESVPDYYGARTVSVNRGEAVPIDVWVNAFNNVDNVRVEVSLKGYERGTISYTSDVFELEQNTVKKVPLVLNLPEDLDASETYTLTIEVSDKHNSFEEEHLIRIKEKRHLLNVLDVIFRPSSTVEAGRFLRTVVRVENLGARSEEDIKVTVSIPELGVSTRDFIDELVTEDEEEDDDESSLSTNELVLQIPKDAKEGDYEVRVDVEFNRGNDVETIKKTVHVLGETEKADETETIVSLDSTSKTLAQGEEGVYRLTFANLGEERNLYSVEVLGTETWADLSVEPGFLSVGPSESGDLLVKVTPKEAAALGSKVFTLRIKADNKLVKEVNLNANVAEKTAGLPGIRNVLEVIFAVLVLVLIILALVIAFRKVRGREEGPEVGSNSEQTYY